jgi:hypothetical protein
VRRARRRRDRCRDDDFRAFLREPRRDRLAEEAFAFIDRDKKAAADYCIRVTGTKEAPEDIIAMLGDPLLKFGLVPSKIIQQADFMYRKA